MVQTKTKSIFWHRRDLRINDNAGLFNALKNCHSVQPIFIFDSTILSQLPNDDQRIIFIHQYIVKLKKLYNEFGADILVYFGNPIDLIPQIVSDLKVDKVYTNRDYEPSAIQRDKKLFEILSGVGVDFIGSKDQVVFEKAEVVKQDGLPYTVFTPYSRKWKEKLNDFYLKSYPVEKYINHLEKSDKVSNLISLTELGFSEKIKFPFPSEIVNLDFVKEYHLNRDYPALNKTTRLSVHLRFGTISIRELTITVKEINETYLNELIWREFYQMILYHFPESVSKSFKKQYDNVVWKKDEVKFKAWCEGKTGYPIVDAGMRELNETGFMHNRVRMVVASFLTKHLSIDWRWGEAYFAQKLMDYEQASNIGGWQWAASSGCDAVPYFRIFNPTSQQEKFDKDLKYVKHWVKEFGTLAYPNPIVDHKAAREYTLNLFKSALN